MVNTVFIEWKNKYTSIEKDFLAGVRKCSVFFNGEDIRIHSNSLILIKRLYYQNNKIFIRLKLEDYISAVELFEYLQSQFKVKLIVQVYKNTNYRKLEVFDYLETRQDLLHLSVVKKYLSLPNKKLLVSKYIYDKKVYPNIKNNTELLKNFIRSGISVRMFPDIHRYQGYHCSDEFRGKRLRLFNDDKVLYISMDTNKATSLRTGHCFNIDSDLDSLLNTIRIFDEAYFA